MAYANKQLNTLAPLPIPIPSGGIQVQLNTLAEGAPRAAWATRGREIGTRSGWVVDRICRTLHVQARLWQ